MRGLFRSHCWSDIKSQKRGPDCGMAIIQRSDRRIARWRGQKIATDKLLIHGEGEGLMWRGTSYMMLGGGERGDSGPLFMPVWSTAEFIV